MKIVISIFCLATILIVIWFRDGNIMGTAEDSLIFYNISRFLPESQYAWMEHPGLGRVTVHLTAARPTYEALNFLQVLGFPNYLIQALTFWFILVSAGLGVYLTVKEFFPQLQNRYVLLSVLFYLFNPLSLVNVWNRFLSDYIFAFGLLPIVTFIFIKGLKKKNYLWSLVLVLVLPLYSFAFTYLAFDILLWIFFFTLTLLFFVTNKELNARIFYIKYFFLTLLLFSLTNLWWIGQLMSLKLFKNIHSSVLNFDISGNLDILDALSKKMGNLSDIFRLTNASFLNENSLWWVKTFHSLPFVIMQYLITSLILYSIIRGIRNKSVLILGGLFFVSIYLAKGINPPFGELYKLIFTSVPFLQVFRNPFEKASFILALSATLLIGFSVFNLVRQLPKKFGNLLYFGLLCFIVLVWGFPFYTGWVFTSPDPPTNNYKVGYKVKVPHYYHEADGWLKGKGDNFRFIGFPLGDEGITYNWEKGYSGVELSTALFATPGILHNTAVPYYHELVPHIQKTLLSQDNFLKLANVLNVKFLFIRHDIDYKLRKMENPAIIDKNFAERQKNNQIKKVANFGQLSFWENMQWKDRTFYPGRRIVKSSNDQQVSELTAVDVNEDEVLMDAKNIQALNSESEVSISYEKINPTRYIVHVKNASPFILVFSELFNNAWQAFYEDNKLDKHFRVNFYANGWYIERRGNYDILIEFIPQRLLLAGEKISSFSYASVLLILFIYLFRKKWKA